MISWQPSTTNIYIYSQKRKEPSYINLQNEVIKIIAHKYKLGYKLASSKLNEYIKKAIGKDFVKGGDITWTEALQKTKEMLQKII